MVWAWVWFGAARVVGFGLGVTLMSLLLIAQDSGPDDGGMSRLRPNRGARTC